MTDALPSVPPTVQTASDKPKRRKCLRCQSNFQSGWVGERICSRCKNTSAWRAGAPVTPRHVNARKSSAVP